jgi:ketosteroid isomerase-like protein
MEMPKKLPGINTRITRKMLKAGESMNVENFAKFYTKDTLYQFSNFPVAYGLQGICDSLQLFLDKVEAVYHDIRAIWEQDNTVICQMDVTYIRHDGKVFTLPCCDTIRFAGDKIQELRIYIDITPIFSEISYSSSESPPLSYSLKRAP